MKTLVVEGWRFLPHSYAVVNHWQLLELLQRQGLQVFHTDMPYAMPSWRPDTSLFDPARDAMLRGIPPRPTSPGFRPDAVLRVGWPFWFHGDPSGCPTFVWGTTEFKIVEPVAIGSRRTPFEDLSQTPCRLIACTNWAKVGFVNAGAAPDRVDVIPCGVDTSIFTPATPERRAELRRQLGWEGKFVVLNVSAMTPNKGIPYLLAAVAELIPRFPQLHLVLKGTDNLYGSQNMAGQAFASLPPELAQRLQGHMGYLGQTLSTAQMVSMLQAADLYVSPYRGEGFNLPVLEGAACGLASICTASGSTEDFIDDGFALRIPSREVPRNSGGILLEPSQGELIRLLAQAIEDDGFRRRAAEVGPVWVRERFTWAHTIDKTLGLLFPGEVFPRRA